MPHVNDHILRSPQSPHQYPNEEDRAPPRSYGKMPTDAEMTPHRRDAYSPHRWRQPAFNDLTHSANVNSSNNNNNNNTSSMSQTPPASPHAPILRPEYASYEGPFHHPPHGPPMSHRGGGGYSYFHHQPPPPPRHYPHYPQHPQHHPEIMMGGPPPPPPHYTSPSRYPHHQHPYADTPPSSTTSYYEYQANFIPPSASMTSTATSFTEDEYSHHHPHHPQQHYDAISPQSTTSMHSQPAPHGGSNAEVNEVGENDVLCGRYETFCALEVARLLC